MTGHGLRATYVRGCRCPQCRAANTAYQKQRNRYGYQQAQAAKWVDPARAVEHVAALRAQGVGLRLISDQTGIARSSLSKLRSRSRISVDTEARILAVYPLPARVDGTGTRRRLQALMAIGWSGQQLADRMGWTNANLHKLLRDTGNVSTRTAQLVAGIYDRLWDRPGSSVRARNLASRKGWAPPLAWDDDTIDDPQQAAADWQRSPRRTRSSEELLEDYADTFEHHQGDWDIAASRLGVSREALERAVYRARRSA